VLGLTVAVPKVLVLDELGVDELGVEADDVLVLLDGEAAVAGWLERARPTVAAKAATEPNTSPRFASAARRRAIWIRVAGIDLYGTTPA
jgi:hypothetical protein